MASVVDDWLSSSSISSPSRATAGSVALSSALSSWLDPGGGLDSTGVCVTATEAGHECRLSGPCLDHSVVAASTHIDCFGWSGIWVCGLKCGR